MEEYCIANLRGKLSAGLKILTADFHAQFFECTVAAHHFHFHVKILEKIFSDSLITDTREHFPAILKCMFKSLHYSTLAYQARQ